MRKGNENLNRGNYEIADSLYTLIVKESFNGDVYFNRAQARLHMNDTCGYCNDLENAYLLFEDKEARNVFNQNCQNSPDTSYFGVNGELLNKESKFRYYKIRKISSCTKQGSIELHDKKAKLQILPSDLASLGNAINSKPVITDMIGRAYLKEGEEIYYNYFPVTMNRLIDDQIINFKKTLLSYIKGKYPDLKKYKDEYAIIYLRIIIQKDGKISEVNVVKTHRINPDFKNMPELSAGLEKAFKGITSLTPLKVMNKPVGFESVYELEI